MELHEEINSLPIILYETDKDLFRQLIQSKVEMTWPEMLRVKHYQQNLPLLQHMIQTEAIIKEYIENRGNDWGKNLTEFLILNTKGNILDLLHQNP